MQKGVNNKAKILHICHDYPHTKLYHQLIDRLGDIAENVVYVAQREVPVNTNYSVVFTGRNFGIIERTLFFGKQRFILQDIERKLTEKFDVIHAHTLFSAGYAAYRLHKSFGIPYIVAVRNTDVNTFFHYMVHLRQVGVKIMLNAAAVVFISPAYKEAVLKNYVPKRYREEISKKSFVIPNGIDDFFLENQPSEMKSIDNDLIKLIYVGEVNYNKNLLTTLKACKLLEERGYKSKLTVVGKITEPKLSFIKDSPFVEYHAYCQKEEVIEYYRHSDIFVMPSIKETFGLVYAEALSQGLPIIYSKGQGIDGYFDEGKVGYHVNNKMYSDVADAIEKIIERYPSLTESAIKSSKSFSWDSISDIYKKLYLQIINKQELEIMEYQRCNRCVMDNLSDNTISFDSDGCCNYCNDVLKRHTDYPKSMLENFEGIARKLRKFIGQ